MPASLALLLGFCGAAASSQLPPFLSDALPTGPLSDTTCDIEAVEQANEKQIHAVIDGLVSTTFFRLINVNMETKCQYFGVKEQEEEEEPECTGGKVEPEEPDVEAVPLCSLGA